MVKTTFIVKLRIKEWKNRLFDGRNGKEASTQGKKVVLAILPSTAETFPRLPEWCLDVTLETLLISLIIKTHALAHGSTYLWADRRRLFSLPLVSPVMTQSKRCPAAMCKKLSAQKRENPQLAVRSLPSIWEKWENKTNQKKSKRQKWQHTHNMFGEEWCVLEKFKDIFWALIFTQQ